MITLTKAGNAETAATPAVAKPAPMEWNLRLYVAGPTPKSVVAFRNLEYLCERHLAGRYHIRFINPLKNPQLAMGNQILVVPTVVRNLPSPTRKVGGNLCNTERVLVGLDLRARDADPFAPRKGGVNV